MNIQEFNKLKVGDMVKVIGLGGGYIYDRIVAIERLCENTFIYNDWANILRLRNQGAEWFRSNSIIRKIEKPEPGKGYFCETCGIAEKFLEDCEAWGIKWNSGDRATSTKVDFWRDYLEEGVVFYMIKNLISREVYITAGSIKQLRWPSSFALSDDINYAVEYPSGKVLWDRAEEVAKKKAEPVSFKVRCVKAPSNSSFTVGNIYDWDEGTLYEDKGSTFRCTVESTNPDEWKFTITKFVKVTEEELEAEESLAEVVNNLGKPATLRDEINKRYQEAWIKFAKAYADTDSIKCYKNKYKCCSCVNYKPAVKEVKRPAKAGEYIKIVNEWHNSLSRGKYTNGDIGLVTMLNDGAIKATINGYDDVPVSDWEYVVLENYIPEVKEVKRPAKAGEYIRLIKPVFTFNQAGDILKVDYAYRNGGVSVKVEDHPRDAGKPAWTDSNLYYYGYDRYVVLENYRPE